MTIKAVSNPSPGPLLSKGDLVFALVVCLATSLGALAIPQNQSTVAVTPAMGSIHQYRDCGADSALTKKEWLAPPTKEGRGF